MQLEKWQLHRQTIEDQNSEVENSENSQSTCTTVCVQYVQYVQYGE